MSRRLSRRELGLSEGGNEFLFGGEATGGWEPANALDEELGALGVAAVVEDCFGAEAEEVAALDFVVVDAPDGGAELDGRGDGEACDHLADGG